MIFDVQKALFIASFCLVIYIRPASAQQTSKPDKQIVYADLVRRAYGLDQDLINGIQYYSRYRNSNENPYFLGSEFLDGSVIIRGRIYDHLKLKYDLHSQNIEIEYTSFTGGKNQVINIMDHVEAFRCGDHYFHKLNLDGGAKKFYQVIHTEGFTCYIYWEKELVPLGNNTRYTGEFADASGSFLLEKDGTILGFKNRKSFVELFPGEHQKEINRLLRRNQFRPKKASPSEISRNMNAVSNLIALGDYP